MAESNSAGAPALSTPIESGDFAEKEAPPANPAPTKEKGIGDDDEDEDIDALIEDLESQDGHGLDDDEEDATPGGGRTVPEDLLQTDTRIGMCAPDAPPRTRRIAITDQFVLQQVSRTKKSSPGAASKLPRLPGSVFTTGARVDY